MGCNLCILRDVEHTSGARLMGPDGKLRRVGTPVSAAQLAFEAPGHVVSRASDLVRGRRVSAMRPAERLLAGEVYVLLPEDRVGSRIDYRQMSAYRRALRRRRCSGTTGKLSVESSAPYENGVAKGVVVEKGEEAADCVSGQPEAVWWPGRPYRWRPFLSTITEV